MLKTYKLDFGWEIAVPEDWLMEKRGVGSYIFYPEDVEDETTLYASALHSEDHKMLTPERLMKEAFDRGIPDNVQEETISADLNCKAFSRLGTDGVYQIGAGFYTAGDLLSLNVYAKSEESARSAASGFSQTKFKRGGRNAF